MWLFIAHYVDMNTEDKIDRSIEFDEHDLSSKECYLHAMSVAYDMKKPNECLGSLEFISC